MKWLIAVELALLKGRHPLLKDVEVTINPSEGLAIMESSTTDTGMNVKKFLDLIKANSSNRQSIGSVKNITDESIAAAPILVRSRQVQENLDLDSKKFEANNDALQKFSSTDAELISKGTDPVDNDRGQALQTTQVVMNMLDITMPGVLKDEEKNKVMHENYFLLFDNNLYDNSGPLMVILGDDLMSLT